MSDINTCRGFVETHTVHMNLEKEFSQCPELEVMSLFEKGNWHYFLFKIQWSVYLFNRLNALSAE